MLTLQQIKDNPERVIERLAVKGFDGKEVIGRVISLDNERKRLQLNNDNKAAELNRLAAQIGALMKQGKKRKPPLSRKPSHRSKKNRKRSPPPSLRPKMRSAISF